MAKISFPKDWMYPEPQAAENSFEEICRQVFESFDEPLRWVGTCGFWQFNNPYEVFQMCARTGEGNNFLLRGALNLFTDEGKTKFNEKITSLLGCLRCNTEYKNFLVELPGKLRVKGDVSWRQWNAFVSKLHQFAIIASKTGLLLSSAHRKKIYFVGGRVQEAIQFSGFIETTLMASFTRKILPIFREVLDGALQKPPLSRFFTKRMFICNDDAILYFVLQHFADLFDHLNGIMRVTCEESFSLIAKHVASTLSFDNLFKDEKTFCRRFGLYMVDENFKFSSADPDVAQAVTIFKRLLGGLDECWRRCLMVMSFNFGYDFDKNGRPARVEEMTFSQFYERCAAEWDATTEGGQSETNGKLLEKAEAAIADLRKEFLANITEEGVKEYRRKLVAASVP